MSKQVLVWLLLLAAIAFGGYTVYQKWYAGQEKLPPGIASGNGRVEAKLVDVAAKEPLRIKEILVDEGKLVEKGQVVARLDTATLDAELAEAVSSVATAQQRGEITKSTIAKKKSESEFAEVNYQRATALIKEKTISQEEFDRYITAVKVSRAAVLEEEGKLKAFNQEVETAKANVARIQSRIDDATLKSPVRGRVLYRLAEVGEVLGAGGKVLTLVNLEDVYMEIFLPAADASRLAIGAEARITSDHRPGKAAAGYVSFVSPEAQFTPKQVETKSERDKLMFRVKIQVPAEIVSAYIEQIKTGVRGMGYVKVDPNAVWPDWLQDLVAPPLKPQDVNTAPGPEKAPAAEKAPGTDKEQPAA
jgi:HlyD family secretion protein